MTGQHLTRRQSLVLGVLAGAGVPARPAIGGSPRATPADDSARVALDALPAQDPRLVREMVIAAHGNARRVNELAERMPRLANAAIDHGFGDWESALGAAAHTGQRAIAGTLLAHGARPDHFAWAMLGHLAALQAAIEASPGLQRVRGPHGLSLLSHARAGGEASAEVVAYLEALGGADEPLDAAPLADDDREAIVGVYRFGPGVGERFEVFEKNGAVWIKREGGTPRGLRHEGSRAFSPAGAPEARVTFAPVSGRAERLVVTAPLPIVTAERDRP